MEGESLAAEDLRALLERVASGHPEAFSHLCRILYDDLRSVAHWERARRDPGDTLSTTVLVHELYLRLAERSSLDWKDERHFLRAAGQAVRHYLVDRARERRSLKRGAHAPHLPLERAEPELGSEGPVSADDLLALDEALTRLGHIDPVGHAVVELRYFGGLTIARAADVLGLPVSTVNDAWRTARAFLADQMDA